MLKDGRLGPLRRAISCPLDVNVGSPPPQKFSYYVGYLIEKSILVWLRFVRNPC